MKHTQVSISASVTEAYLARLAADSGAGVITVPMNLPDASATAAYCRARDAKLIADFPDFVSDGEFSLALNRLIRTARAGFSGVAVNDLGLLNAARELLPDFPVYAGSAFNIHNLFGVLELKKLGVRGVSCADSLTGEELQVLYDLGGIDLETISDFEPGKDSSGTGTVYQRRTVADSLDARARAAALGRSKVKAVPKPKYRGGAYTPPADKPFGHAGPPRLTAALNSAGQLTSALSRSGPLVLYVPYALILENKQVLAGIWQNSEICAVFPNTLRDSELPAFDAALRELQALHVTSVALGNIGHIAIAKRFGFDIRAGEGFNVCNTEAIRVLSGFGFKSCVLGRGSGGHSRDELRKLGKYIDTELTPPKGSRTAEYSQSGLAALRLEFRRESEKECLEAISLSLS
ncbi:MAG: U32 family peptidase [Oscillospiraceae bacterium]|nr:U32 family peptidase [Oscillospiraceae bacterium]